MLTSPFRLVVGQLALVLALSYSAANSPAKAQDTLRAAAVVNDEVISVLDLVMRTRLAILASGLKDSPEARGRFQEQVLRALIDERIQLQEAERLNITVAEEEVAAAIENLARQNKMDKDQFVGFLARSQVLPSALLEQIRAELTWQSVVQRRLKPSVVIGEEEIDEFIGRMESRSGEVQHRVSEILLTVDNTRQEETIREASQRLAEQLRLGAEFSALARQFSQSATASVGGDLGWVQAGQLPDELGKALTKMSPGDMFGPVRTFGGYYLLWLRDRRKVAVGDIILDLKRLLFALPRGASQEQIEAAQTQAASFREEIDGCDTFDALAAEHGSPGSGDLGRVKLSDLPPVVRRVVEGLPLNQPSKPVLLPAGITLLLVCGRESNGVDRERIRTSLTNQRLDLLSRRYLRDLRRAANVDVRL